MRSINLDKAVATYTADEKKSGVVYARGMIRKAINHDIEGIGPTAARISEALEEVQKRARVRFVEAPDVIETVSDELEHFRACGISKTAAAGTVITYQPGAETFPGAYKGRPEGTWFKIKYTKTGASLIAVGRDYCDTAGNARRVELSESAKKALIENF